MLFDDMEDMRREAEREAKAAKASKAAEAAKTKAAEAAEAAKTKAAKTAEKERSAVAGAVCRVADAVRDARRRMHSSTRGAIAEPSAAAAVSASVPIVGRSPSHSRVVSVVVAAEGASIPAFASARSSRPLENDGSFPSPAPLVPDRSAECHHPEHHPEPSPEHPNTPLWTNPAVVPP